jgi:CRISPR system Cascade subunit CasB
MKKTINFICLKELETRKILRNWWDSLGENRGARARLRRAERPDDVLLTEPFFQFLQKMPACWSEPLNLPASTLVAAALAHVKNNSDDESFATQLAMPKKGSEKPCVSELRFQQLQKSRDPDEFFRRLLRAIRLVENRVNIESLADNILHWMKEYRFGIDRKPQKRLAVIWANEYYTTISKTSKHA